MKTILIPTDFSNSARNAVEYAITLFGEANRFILINSYEEPRSTTSSMISLKDILHESSLDSLAEEEQYLRVEKNHPNLQLETVSIYGDPVHTITQYAENHDVDLIAMGTTGATGLKEVFMGSVAASVVQNAHCPVLAVPLGFDNRKPKNVLFASDLKSVENGELPEVFVELARECESEITVLTVSSDQEQIDLVRAENGYDLHVQLGGLPHKFEVIESEDVEVGIEEFARVNGMDMIITIPRKVSWLGRLFNPSISKKLAQHIDIPMIALAS